MHAAMSKERRLILTVLYYAAYTVIAFLFISPILYLFVSAFKNDTQIVTDMSTYKAFLPVGELSLDNFKEIISKVHFFRFFKNSAIVAILDTSLCTIINAMVGYALGMLNFKGRKTMISVVLALSIIPTEAIIINRFIVTNQIGMLNSYWGLALPSVAYPMYMYLYYNHFKGMPRELMEAAVVDGASYAAIFWKVMLPLSKPILATVAIMAFIRAWGDLLWPTLVSRDETYRTLPWVLRALSNDVYIYWGQIFAFSSLMVLPIMIIFLIFQKQFVSSLTTSGIKG